MAVARFMSLDRDGPFKLFDTLARQLTARARFQRYVQHLLVGVLRTSQI